MLAKVHLARKELGLDEGTYRAVLSRVTGLESAGSCSEGQLGQVLDEFKRLGWKPAPIAARARPKVVVDNKLARGPSPAKRRAADSPMAGKARAMWISLHQLGVVRNPSEQALEAFARRQLKVEQLQWADQGQAYKLIEALKGMGERAGWDQHLKDGADFRELKARLIEAQWKIAARLGAVADFGGNAMMTWLNHHAGVRQLGGVRYFTDSELLTVSRVLAVRIWEAKERLGEGVEDDANA